MTGDELDGVDLDLLADYVGGALIGSPDEDRVAALVTGDPAWRSAYEQVAPAMTAVGAALRELAPEPMPDDLATRLDTLFTAPPAEAPPAADDADGESAAPVPAKVLDLAGARRDRAARPAARRWRRWAAPVSVAAAVLAFGGFGLTQITGSATTQSSDSSGESSVAGADVAPMVAEAPAIDQVVTSGIDYSAETLTQVPEPAVETKVSEASEADDRGATTEPSLMRLLAPDALLACLQAIARENGGGVIAVQSVDYARYLGAPALVVHFTAANGGWAWAVGPDCGTGTGASAREQLPVR